ncbi:hypothetical protein CVT24_001577 [Panaeolus cyanescens]|uniref:Uncharacterized protein n=1 Tax=Panaeolus cyanescens TaxID=181874 RepID=A0A409YYT9_9AGAR|nr:hypothetical protein CVT24_001577 [Panaeolus cyanescens]
MKYLDDLDQVIKYSGAWNFRSETGALNGGYSLSKDPNAGVTVTYSFRSVEFWSPLWPAPIQLVISVGARATIVDLQDHDATPVPLPTDVPPRSTKPSRVVWEYRGLVQQEYTIHVRAASSGVSPAYVVVDTFGFDLEDPPSPTSSNDPPPPPPSPTESTSQPTSAPSTPTPSQPTASQPGSSSSIPSTSSSSSDTSLSSGTSTSAPSSSTNSTSSLSPSDSTTLPFTILPGTDPTVIQGNGGGNPAAEGSKDKENTGLIAGLSVAGCVLAGLLAGLIWFLRRRKRAVDAVEDDTQRADPFETPEGSESARPYSLAEKARLPGNGNGGQETGLSGVLARVSGKRNVVMDVSPPGSSAETGGPSPAGVFLPMNEKTGLHDAYNGSNNDVTPTSSSAQLPPSAPSAHGSEISQPNAVIRPSENTAPQESDPAFRTSMPTARVHPPSMVDSPPTYSAADPTSVLWIQRIQMAAALPTLVQNQPPETSTPPRTQNRESVVRVQMDPELD